MTPSSPLRPSVYTLTTAGMVSIVNSVVIGASAGLVLAAVGTPSLAVTLAGGAVVGASALAVHRTHHRHARDAHEPETIDRYATSWRTRRRPRRTGPPPLNKKGQKSDASRDDQDASTAEGP